MRHRRLRRDRVTPCPSSSRGCAGSSTAATTPPGWRSCATGSSAAAAPWASSCNLEESLQAEPLSGAFGLGHTRWATHGRPSEENAHPHQDCSGPDRGRPQRHHRELPAPEDAPGQRRATSFVTQTDTEVVAHLVESHYKGTWRRPSARRSPSCEGIYALVLLHRTSRRSWWRRGRGRPSWSASARASASWPPTSPPSCPTRATSSSSTTATWSR